MAEKVNERNNVSKMADKGGNIINPAIHRINPEFVHHGEPDPLVLSSGIAQKKKSQFRITSVSTHNSNDGEVDSADDLDESHTEDASSELIDISKNTDVDQDPSSEDTISNDNNDDIVNCNNENAIPYQCTRFKVVKIESTEPFRRGRWMCMDFLDPPIQDPKLDLGIPDRDIASGNSSAGSSVHFVPGDNHPSENPLATHGIDGTINHPTIENMLYTTAQSLPHNFPNANQNMEYTHLTSQTATLPMNLPLTNNMQQTIPQNISNISAPSQMLQQTNVHKNVLQQAVGHPITMPPNIAQNVSQTMPANITGVLGPTGMTCGVHHQGLSQSTTTNLQPIHPQGMQQSTVPVIPQSLPSTMHGALIQGAPGLQQILHQGQTQSLFPQGVSQSSAANLQPHNIGQQILTSVPHSVQTGPSNVITITNSGHPINQTLVGPGEGAISLHTQNSVSKTDAGIGTTNQAFSAPMSSASDISVGVPQAEHVSLVQSVKDSIEEETDRLILQRSLSKNINGKSASTSGSSTVAIDNKIEQAMDLVKSHLMFAVREEVEVLKERITELMERIGQLEYENNILKANAPPETLESLAQISHSTTKPHSQAPPSSS